MFTNVEPLPLGTDFKIVGAVARCDPFDTILFAFSEFAEIATKLINELFNLE